MAANIPPTEQDYELLSAYLDNQLSAADRTQLERRLAAEPALRAVLNDLQRTVDVLKFTPQLALPRNFTLDVARYRRPTPWWARYRTMQLVGALGTAASIILILLGVTLFSTNLATAPLPAASNAGRNAQTSNSIAAAPTGTATALPTLAAANKSVVPTTTFVVPTLVPTQIAAAGAGQLPSTPTAMAEFSAQSAQPAPGIMSAQAAESTTAPPTQSPSSGPETSAAEVPPAQPTLRLRLTALPPSTDQLYAATSTANEANTGDAAASGFVSSTATPAPTMTIAPSATSSVTPSATVTATKTEASKDTVVAVAPTQAPDSITTRRSAAPPALLIIGIALLVFSVMLFGIGWLRSRLRG